MAMDVNAADGVARRLIGNEDDNEEVEIVEQEDIPALRTLAENEMNRWIERAAQIREQKRILSEQEDEFTARAARAKAKFDHLDAMYRALPQPPAAVVAVPPQPPPPQPPAAPPQPPPPPPAAPLQLPPQAPAPQAIPANLSPLPNFVTDDQYWACVVAAVLQVNNRNPTAQEIVSAKAAYGPDRKKFPEFSSKQFPNFHLNKTDATYTPFMMKAGNQESLGVCQSKDEAIAKGWLVFVSLQSQNLFIGAGGQRAENGSYTATVFIRKKKNSYVCRLPEQRHVHGVHYRMREVLECMSANEKRFLTDYERGRIEEYAREVVATELADQAE